MNTKQTLRTSLCDLVMRIGEITKADFATFCDGDASKMSARARRLESAYRNALALMEALEKGD